MEFRKYYSCGRPRKVTDAEELGLSFSCTCGRVHVTRFEDKEPGEGEADPGDKPQLPVGLGQRFKLAITGLKVDFGIWWAGVRRVWNKFWGKNTSTVGFAVRQQAVDHLFESPKEPATERHKADDEALETLNLGVQSSTLPSTKALKAKLLRLLNGDQRAFKDLLAYYRRQHPTMKEEDRIDKAIIDLERDRR